MHLTHTCSLTRSPRVSFIAFAASPIHRLSHCPPCHPPTFMDSFSRYPAFPEVSAAWLEVLYVAGGINLKDLAQAWTGPVMTPGVTPLCTCITQVSHAHH